MSEITEADLRAMIIAAAKEHAPSLLRNGISQWCAANNVNRARVNEFINGKRLPTSDILRALGLRWAIIKDGENAR